MDDDQALVRAAVAGSDLAFARLIERHQAAVRGFLRRLSRSAADADDLAQETFLAAWSRLPSVELSAGFRSWLLGVAYRKWMSHGRSDRRRRERETAADWSGPNADPDVRLTASAALSILPPDQGAAVALCLGGGLSHAEAAAALSLPVGTIKSHVARGRTKLLDHLGGAR